MLHIWLPENRYVKLAFLQDILAGEKLYLETKNVRKQNVPARYNEFSVKAIWPKINKDEGVLKYLPTDDMCENRFPNREYVWGILHTIRSEWATTYTKKALEERYRQRGET